MVSVIDHDDDYMAQMGVKSYGALKPGKGSEGTLVEDEKKKEQQRSKRPRLTEDLLVQKNGLPWLVSDMTLSCGPCRKLHWKGKEGTWINQVLDQYRKWALQLYPRLAFEDLAVRVEKLGSTGRMREFMSELREEEHMRYLTEEFGHGVADKMKNYGVFSSDSTAPVPIRKGRYDEPLQEDEETAGLDLLPNKEEPEVLLPPKVVDNEDELLTDT